MIQGPGAKSVSILAWREAFAGVGVALALASAIAGCSSGSGDNPAIVPLYEGKDNSEDQYDNACLEKTANQGDRCTKDCVTPCGYGSVGIKYCSCAGGVYTQCACRPPDDWEGAPTAPYCDSLTVLPRYMGGQFCGEVGLECLSDAPVDGSEQTGCRCVPDPVLKQSWSCKPKSELGISDAAPSCLTITRGSGDFLAKKPCDTKYQECITRDYFDGSSPKGCVCLGQAPSLAWNCTGTNRWFRAEDE